MSTDDPVNSALEAVLADPKARPSTKVQAAKQLAALRGPQRGGVAGEPLGQMQKIVEEHCPGATATWGEPADVMRDLDI